LKLLVVLDIRGQLQLQSSKGNPHQIISQLSIHPLIIACSMVSIP
jgi:hypothetical protein